mmetsp:Transcript_42802/g.97533  ORF Transcript_42802/g.97533 Transcript_42802/m.97533 type:complete len:236 (-) Transcript_42802:1215-1922(-)
MHSWMIASPTLSRRGRSTPAEGCVEERGRSPSTEGCVEGSLSRRELPRRRTVGGIFAGRTALLVKGRTSRCHVTYPAPRQLVTAPSPQRVVGTQFRQPVPLLTTIGCCPPPFPPGFCLCRSVYRRATSRVMFAPAQWLGPVGIGRPAKWWRPRSDGGPGLRMGTMLLVRAAVQLLGRPISIPRALVLFSEVYCVSWLLLRQAVAAAVIVKLWTSDWLDGPMLYRVKVLTAKLCAV